MSSTSTTKTKSPFELPFTQFEELSEQLIEGARKAGGRYLEAYEQAAARAIALERKLASASKQEWLAQLLESHAELSEELTAAYTAAARTLIAA